VQNKKGRIMEKNGIVIDILRKAIKAMKRSNAEYHYTISEEFIGYLEDTIVKLCRDYTIEKFNGVLGFFVK